MLTWRDIRIKYKQTVMGFMWAILMPMIIVTAGMLVRYAVSRVTGVPMTLSHVASVSVKAVPWAFFVGSVRFATVSLISNPNLVTKIYFPRELFPIAATLSHLFDFTVASISVICFLLIGQIGVSLNILWIPVLVIILCFLVMGLGILLSALALFFRDVKYLVEIGLTFGIFFTPVFYDVKMLGGLGKILLLNPLAGILLSFDDCIVGHSPPQLVWLLYSTLCSVIIFILAIVAFKKMEPVFAESI
jgi:ABC-type polysaccharide/polyol phosphate export permease